MKGIARIFLLFTLCAFVGATSASAAMPCCMKASHASAETNMPNCHMNMGQQVDHAQASTQGDYSKHAGMDCSKCQCAYGLSVALLHPFNIAYHARIADVANPSLAMAIITHDPITLDDPPKFHS